MHQKKPFQVRGIWTFTKKPNPSRKVRLASGVFLNLKDAEMEKKIDFEQEGRRLATILKWNLP